MVVVSCPVILMKSQEVSSKGFLNELVCNLVMSSGMVVGFSRNSGKRSNPLSCLFNSSLQSSSLKVSVGSGSINILRNTWGDRETGE
jgi:hypothetical protein